eukprot:3818386-Rhodomonas_salina.6
MPSLALGPSAQASTDAHPSQTATFSAENPTSLDYLDCATNDTKIALCQACIRAYNNLKVGHRRRLEVPPHALAAAHQVISLLAPRFFLLPKLQHPVQAVPVVSIISS